MKLLKYMGNFRTVHVQFNNVNKKLLLTYVKAVHREIRSCMFSRDVQTSDSYFTKKARLSL